MTESADDYCDAFTAWLKGDRKKEPPCMICAEASALRKRNKEKREAADNGDKHATEMITKAHPRRP